MKNRFLNISIGVSIMLLSGGFFLRSVPTANAAPTPETFVQEGTNKIGKYMFQVYIGSDDRRYGVVMNTETGKSKAFYYLSYNDGFVADGKAFPDNPMGE
jgi:hypothetical protein